jgi:hypothetical protein
MGQIIHDVPGGTKQVWDDDTRRYSEWVNGTRTLDRAYNAGENTRADTLVSAKNAQTAALDEASKQAAIIAAIEATASPPVDGGAWVQPTGAHDAYAMDSTVSHLGKNWISLTPFNVWAPGTSSWREVVAEGYPAWVQPTGAQDAYQIGNKVSFQGSNYESLINANTWSPSVYPAGWKLI